jgi:hypothetical protein
VKIEACDGSVSGTCENARSKVMPSAASAVMFGVFARSDRSVSIEIRMTDGFSGARLHATSASSNRRKMRRDMKKGRLRGAGPQYERGETVYGAAVGVTPHAFQAL